MVETFEDDGIRFRYPENWRLEREDTDTGWTVVVQSPETAFAISRSIRAWVSGALSCNAFKTAAALPPFCARESEGAESGAHSISPGCIE